MSVISLKSLTIFSTLAALLLCGASAGLGQEQNPSNNEQYLIDEIPPPVISLAKNEAEQLKAEIDFKKRTQLCLTLADSRLQRAESLTSTADFHTALTELGAYQAIVANGIKFLQSNSANAKKMRDNMRRLEMSLRTHVPRIESIRRSTPSEFAVHIKSVLNFARDTRSRALESFFDDTVIAESPNSGINAAAASSTNGLSYEKKP